MHAGLSNALTATFLALLVACLGRVLARRPAILHCLWLLVLLKLVTPPLYEVPIPWPESLASREESAPTGADIQLLQVDFEALGQPVEWSELQADALEIQAAPAETDPALIARAAIAGAFWWLTLHWVPVLGALWLAGTLATAVISVRRILRFQLVLREATPGSDQIQSWVDDLSASLGIARPPQVWWIRGKLSPMLWALGACPRLIIPTELWKGLDERQRGTLLVHELAHLRRGDHRVRIFELVVTSLYWWNPVLWWARQALRDVEEQCCDAWVVWAFPEAAKSYAETLLETLDFLNQSELSEPLLASGFGKVQHLRRRLTMIMSGTTPRLLGLRGALTALSFGALLLPMNASWAQKPEEQQEIRIVVTSDDGKDKVVKSGDAVDATGSFVFAQDPTKGKTGTFVYDTDPLKAGPDIVVLSDAFVVDDKAASDGKAGQKSKVTVVLTTDDSTVSVSADSVEGALKKITEQINAIKAKTPPGAQDRANAEALSQIVKQLEKVAKSQNALGRVVADDGKRGGTDVRKVLVHRLEDVRTTKAISPEKKAEADKMRSKIKELSAELANTQRKLAELEGNKVTFRTVVKPVVTTDANVHFGPVDGKHVQDLQKVEIFRKAVDGDAAAAAASAEALTLTKVAPRVMITGKLPPDQSTLKADEDRIGALEKKLNKVIEALDDLKKSKGN